MKNIYTFLFGLFFIVGNSQQYITVGYKSPEELVKDVFIGAQNASCITVSNVSVKNWQDYGTNPFSYGYFEKGTLPFNIEKGIILSTGSAQKAPGPNSSLLSDGSTNWLGDQDLADAFQQAPSEYVNATSLEFDFIAYNTSGISFEYMLLSEEYQSSGCPYFDSFAFLIKEDGASYYNNIAVVPGTNTPVSSQTVRGGSDCPRNELYFDQFNYPPDIPRLDSPTNYDGQTKVLTAKTDIVPGQKYHIKLVIADYSNTSHDSAVFLKAGSFVGKKDLGPDFLLGTNTAVCEGESTILDATTVGGTNYKWFKDGINISAANDDPKYTVTDSGYYEVTLDVGGCQLKGSIKIEYGEKPLFLQNPSFCNYNEGNPISITLQDLKTQIISNYKDYFQVKFYKEARDANDGNPNFLRDPFEYSSDSTVYIRVESGTCGPVVQEINLLTPKKSILLKDKIICTNAPTTLTAESTFIYYKWMHENGNIIAEGTSVNSINNVIVGNYLVELTSQNGCKLEQAITVLPAELPQIINIEVSGSTATVFVNGGNSPYQYSLDNINFQSSNIFTNIPRGLHSVYVKDTQNCETITKEFLILNLINVITPNADGKNDVLDYSDLSIKKDVKIEIYDRYGNQVFISQKTPYIWDGKINGSVLPMGTYWYILNWIEPDTNLPVTYTGWVLLKNRN